MTKSPYTKGQDIIKEPKMKYSADLLYDSNEDLSTTQVGDSKVSDHFPIIATIAIPERGPDEYQLYKKDKICSNFYINTGGILHKNPEKENNWVIIDPAGAAFLKDADGKYRDNYKRVSGASKAIYDQYNLTNKSHNIKLDYGQARKSEEVFEGKIKGMIHAIGPNENIKPYDNIANFNKKMKECIESIKAELEKLIGDGGLDEETEIRIPLISSGEYGKNIVRKNYNSYISNLVNLIRINLCPFNYKIVLCLYGKTDKEIKREIDNFNAFYNKLPEQQKIRIINGKEVKIEPTTDPDRAKITYDGDSAFVSIEQVNKSQSLSSESVKQLFWRTDTKHFKVKGGGVNEKMAKILAEMYAPRKINSSNESKKYRYLSPTSKVKNSRDKKKNKLKKLKKQ